MRKHVEFPLAYVLYQGKWESISLSWLLGLGSFIFPWGLPAPIRIADPLFRYRLAFLSFLTFLLIYPTLIPFPLPLIYSPSLLLVLNQFFQLAFKCNYMLNTFTSM